MQNPTAGTNPKYHNKLLTVILFFAFTIRLVWVLAVPTQPISDFKEFDRLATGLLSGKGYVSSSGQPTAYRPPGYIFFVAGIYSIFGHHDIAVRLFNVLLGVLSCLLTYYLANELINRRTALLAAFLMAAFPSLIAWTNILATENLFIPLSLGIMITFLKAAKRPAIQWRWMVLCGILSGMAVLIRPAAMLLPGVLVLSMALTSGWKSITSHKLTWLAQLAVVGVVLYGLVFVTVLPWTIRNYHIFGRFVLVATDGGITLLAGHNERALYAEYSVEGPVFDALTAEKLDEVSFDERAYQLAFQFVQQNPAIELRLLVHKLFNFFKDDVSGFTYNALSAINPLPNWLILISKGYAEIFYLLVLGFAVASIFINHYPQDRRFFILVIFIVVWTVFHLAYYGKDRFRLPLTPALVIFAALTLFAVWDNHPGWFRRKIVKPVK